MSALSVVRGIVVGVLGLQRGVLPAPRSAAAVRRASSMRMGASAVAPAALSEVLAREPALHPAFELLRVEMVDEYTIKCATYRHTKSGAEVISAQADDDNKVFGVVFPTPVVDSTGVPHILEHSVLCGSDKYTSKEPFVEVRSPRAHSHLSHMRVHTTAIPTLNSHPHRRRQLLKGSLQTFLNAFTYPDRTCYPVASQNTKDFYNLVNVYLDAVLHPRAKRDPMVLAQEGWHYELEDPDAPLTYKVRAHASTAAAAIHTPPAAEGAPALSITATVVSPPPLSARSPLSASLSLRACPQRDEGRYTRVTWTLQPRCRAWSSTR